MFGKTIDTGTFYILGATGQLKCKACQRFVEVQYTIEELGAIGSGNVDYHSVLKARLKQAMTDHYKSCTHKEKFRELLMRARGFYGGS